MGLGSFARVVGGGVVWFARNVGVSPDRLATLCLLWPIALPGLWAVSWFVWFRPVCGLCGLVGGFVVLAVAWPYIYRGGAVRFC